MCLYGELTLLYNRLNNVRDVNAPLINGATANDEVDPNRRRFLTYL